MSWFYIAIVSALVAGQFGLDRMSELMLAAACVIGYIDNRIPRDISVTIVKREESAQERAK